MMELTQKKIILDTDLGDDIDDAYALALLLCEGKSQILGVTTVYRNALQRAKIASRLIRLFGKNVPVYAGEDFPEKEPLKAFDHVQKDERGVWVIPHYIAEQMAEERVEELGAVDFILKALEENPNEVTLVPIGPLTNLARAYERSPETFKKAKEILIMGGNYTEESPEWNILCDPDAAKTVYASGVPIRAVGIDITRYCTFTDEDLEKLRSFGSEKFKLLVRMTEIWIEHNKGRGIPPTMHDPLTVSELSFPACSFKTGNVRVETEGDKRGCTLVEEVGNPVEFAISADYRKFIDHLIALAERENAR